jgi:transketolase
VSLEIGVIMGKAKEPTEHHTKIHFELGRAIRMREGSDVHLDLHWWYSPDSRAHRTNRRTDEEIQTRLLSMRTLKPLDTEAVLAAAHEAGTIVTVEEHSIAEARILAAELSCGAEFEQRLRRTQSNSWKVLRIKLLS